MAWNPSQRISLALAVIAIAGGLSAVEYGSPAPAGQEPSKATAEKQSNSKSDLELTQKIRQSIYADKSLSAAAHNVMIVTRDGKVTIRGAVYSENEKESVLDKANHIAGGANVSSEIQVASAK
jgi:hyperosmotically inducible protein